MELILNQNIKEKRKELGLSQHKLAIASGLTRQFIYEIERGRRRPSLEGVIKIAGALNCTVDELVK